MNSTVLIYSSVKRKFAIYGRVVELVDSLDSGSSVHCGRAGSSPASPTKRKGHPKGCPFSFGQMRDLKGRHQCGENR